MPGHEGRFIGPVPNAEERAAAAILYVALMTDLSLDIIGSQNAIVIDGGLIKTHIYTSLLAALRPDQTVHTSVNAEGSAFGAAAIVFDTLGSNPFVNDCHTALPASIPGLAEYKLEWRQHVDQLISGGFVEQNA